MEAKEKAQELTKKFKLYVYPFSAGSGYLSGDFDEDVIKQNSKQCALFVVEEILLNFEEIRTMEYHLGKSTAYWRDVKDELKKL
jgi:hypothetical protein